MQNPVPAVFMFQDSHNIRTLTIDGEPWFVAKDIAEVLGYGAPRNAIKQHCKGALKRCLPSASGNQEHYIIPERDLYRLILRSKLPAAEKFEEWVVAEVLPAIRKTGSYTPEPLNTEPISTNTAFKETLSALQKTYPFLKQHHPHACAILNNNINTYMAGAVAGGKDSAVALTEAVNLFAPAYAKSLEPASVPTITVQQPQAPCFPPVPATIPSVDLRNNSLGAGILLAEQSREQLHLLYGHYLGANELGYIIGCSEASANRILFDRGLHEHGDNGYQVTDKGKPYALHIDVDGYFPNRQPRRIIKWHSSVISILAQENIALLKRDFKPRKQKFTVEEKPLSINSQTAVNAVLAMLKFRSPYEQQPLASELSNLVCQFSGPGIPLERWCDC